MLVGEDTLIRAWVVMGWLVCGGCQSVRSTPPTGIVFLLSHARHRINLVLRWLGVYARGGGGG